LKRELITGALDVALSAVGDLIRADDHFLALIVHDPTKTHASVGQLHDALRAETTLAIFDGRMQILPNQAVRWEIGNLAGWLLRRGLQVGADQAISDLQRYLDATEIPMAMISVIAGLKVESRCDLCRGIALLPWDSLADSYEKQTINTRSLTSIGFKWPSAALVQERVFPKRHLSGEDYELSWLDESEIHDVLLCVGVVGPFAPEVLASWLAPPPWAPAITSGFWVPQQEGRPRHDVWSDEQCPAAAALVGKFRALDAATKDALRLPMQRLNMAMRRASSVDSAVDLGISLEALFLSDLQDDRGELTFRLRLRVARYLEPGRDRRELLFKLVGDLYAVRSVAVHTGRIPDSVRGRPASEILTEGFRLTASAIRRFITEGVPDWTRVQLE
jgi:hypothetical protein